MKKYVGLLFLCLFFLVCDGGKRKNIFITRFITRKGKKRQKKHISLAYKKQIQGITQPQIMFSTSNRKKEKKKHISPKREGRVKSIPPKFGVPFDVGMRNSCWYHPKSAEKNVMWQRVKNLYDTYIIDKVEHTEQVHIPKIIHQIWLGGPLPKKYYEWQKSWQRHNPDWEYKLWNEKDIEEFGLVNKHWYDRTPNLGQKSDIARYEILYRIGGLYVDTDFECIGPFDVFHLTCNFYAGIMQCHRGFELCNALIGSAPGHPILKACIETMNIDTKHHQDPRVNVTYTTGPWHLTTCFAQEASSNGGRSVAFPVGYFYPWPWYTHKGGEHDKNPRKKILQWVKRETFAIHHWENSWFNQPAK